MRFRFTEKLLDVCWPVRCRRRHQRSPASNTYYYGSPPLGDRCPSGATPCDLALEAKALQSSPAAWSGLQHSLTQLQAMMPATPVGAATESQEQASEGQDERRPLCGQGSSLCQPRPLPQEQYQNQPRQPLQQESDEVAIGGEESRPGDGLPPRPGDGLPPLPPSLPVEKLQQEDNDDGGSDGELVIVDSEDGDEDEVSELEGQETCGEIGSEGQDQSPGRRKRFGLRGEAQRKMEHGKKWLKDNLTFFSLTMTVVALSSIEEEYQDQCQKEGRDPLTTPVLARLIHSQFPHAVKCRLGARGNQKIHYRKLKLQSTKTVPKQEAGTELVKKSFTSRPEGDCSEIVPILNDIPQKSVLLSPQEELQLEKQALEERKSVQQPRPSAEGGLQQRDAVQKTNTSDHTNIVPEKLDPKGLLPKDPSKASHNSAELSSQDDKESCEAAADRLSQVVKWVTNQGRKHVLLREFAHSASCRNSNCTSICLMFRRVRRHVVAARHACSVLRIYSMLLRLHVSNCKDTNCGLPACPALRATRPGKRSQQQQEQQQDLAKRQATMAVRSPSPAGSLPGSPVNSPPASPPYSQGQMQFVILPVVMPLSDRRCV